MARVSQRRNDASDAGPEIAASQAQEAVGPMAWLRLDASQPVASLVARARAAIERKG
jgi:predicted kinase